MGNNMKFKVGNGYKEKLPLWQQVRAAIKGKQGAIQLLESPQGYFGIVAPQYRQTPENFEQCNKRRLAYFARGRFFNATGRTHDAYVGMIGSKELEYKFPTTMEGFADNVDGMGTSLNDFALEMAGEQLVTARYGILVDPPNLEGATQAQANQSLPKLIGYMAEQIGEAIVMDGKLVYVLLAETYYEKADNDYELKEQTRVLELDNGVYVSRVYRDDELYEETIPTINGSTLDYIPFQFAGAENNKPSYDRPVMFDLAHENMGHFQLSCDNLENLHFHGQGMTNIFTDDTDAITDANPNGVDVGAKGMNVFKASDRVEILQIESTGAIPAEMLRVEQRMIMLGAQVVADNNTNQTATAKKIDSNAEMSQLKRIAVNGSNALTQCGKWAAQMMGANPDEVEVDLNSTFVTDDLTSQDVLAMFAMYQGGAATFEELNEVKRKANYTSKTNDELKDAIDEEGPAGNSEEVAALMLRIEQLEGANNGDD